MGVSVGNAQVQIAGTKFKETGPVLLTHWGLSGPAVIKLSAWAADYLYQQHYNFTALVNWLGQTTEEALRQQLDSHKQQHPKQKVATKPFNELPHRLWTRLCELAEIEEEKIWGELSKRHTNKLIENLIRCEFRIKGKTTFKEEFVTCGGIKLDEIIMERMESKIVPGLFFAGEVLNIDGETGGFNFQSA
jgi:predicted Rossmann fold flavoprotein